MRKILCFFGLHRWNNWEVTFMQNQHHVRYCDICDKTQFDPGK